MQPGAQKQLKHFRYVRSETMVAKRSVVNTLDLDNKA
jgi:hypothetical protein